MNEDTINLLKECNAGCKYAVNSMAQVLPHIENHKLKAVIHEYNDKHTIIGNLSHEMLNEYQGEEMDPKLSGKTFSWISTEMKLMMNNDTHEIANIMIDGCNMGIKSISEYINKYKTASKESLDLAKKLVKIEQEFMNELLGYL
ncbi:MAG: hypothetical protein ACM3X7_07390 [Solirubrobacterales bacterium]